MYAMLMAMNRQQIAQAQKELGMLQAALGILALAQNAWHGVGVALKNIKMLKQQWTTVNVLAIADWQASHEPINARMDWQDRR
jgi:hypothetical protein